MLHRPVGQYGCDLVLGPFHWQLAATARHRHLAGDVRGNELYLGGIAPRSEFLRLHLSEHPRQRVSNLLGSLQPFAEFRPIADQRLVTDVIRTAAAAA